MSKREKRLQKLRQNPNNVAFDDLKQALEAEGFTLDHATGSHHVFRGIAGETVLTVVVPFVRPVKPVYVRQALAAIAERRAAEEKQSQEDKPKDDERPRLLHEPAL